MRAYRVVLIAVLTALAGCSHPLSPTPAKGWVAARIHSVLDGEKFTAHRDFPVGRQGVIRVTVSCVPSTEQLSMSIEGYEPDGSASPLFLDSEHRLEGRLKFRTSGQPLPIGDFFLSDKYMNVARWTVRQVGAAGSPPARLDVGDYLLSLLPMAVEVSDANGQIEIQVPSSDPSLTGAITHCHGPAAPSLLDVMKTTDTSDNGTITATTGVAMIQTPRDAHARSSSASPHAPGQFSGTGTVKPSFDCAKARTPIEYMICSNADLAKADAAVGALYYHRRKADPGDADKLMSAQKAFLAERNRCKSLRCVQHVYDQRFKELSQPAQKAQPAPKAQ